MYGRADDEIPFLQHGDAHPPLEHTEFTVVLTSGRTGGEGERLTRGCAYAPWRRIGVYLRRRRRAGACCCSSCGGGGGARARGGACGVRRELRLGFAGRYL